MEISNNPEVICRMGRITMNTALEDDIYGNVNSTHVLGSEMMNGIGGIQVMVSEQDLADLRAKIPKESARLIIEKCAHPIYKNQLRDYFEHVQRFSFGQHTSHDLKQALSWHIRLQETDSMHPDHQTTTRQF
ncbi:unnamed protein product [Rotaria sordida]|uniref:Acetyl-CoA hydrolase/transferase C-terminal domain-containing protein n=1 Tax=Rotaria sordida TaxID=392033 RepID=A0A815CWL1_9BILA|nr:unnamed protein product [Rotaria sordida]CAF1565194.1 unnamed protein product [Rotaria sordida]